MEVGSVKNQNQTKKAVLLNFMICIFTAPSPCPAPDVQGNNKHLLRAVSCVISTENPVKVTESSLWNFTQARCSLVETLSLLVFKSPYKRAMTEAGSDSLWPFPMVRTSCGSSVLKALKLKVTAKPSLAVTNQVQSMFSG